MNVTKVQLRLARANYAAAKARGDAAAARRHLEQVSLLKARRLAAKGDASTASAAEKATKKARKRARKLEKRVAIQKAAMVAGRPDAELEQVRHLRRLVDDRDGEMRRGALEKLRSLLSEGEFVDVLQTKDPSRLVRTPGPNPRGSEEIEKIGRLVRTVTNPSLPADQRGEAADRLAMMTKGDRSAEQALAEIMTRKTR